jgi:hypothetical protein
MTFKTLSWKKSNVSEIIWFFYECLGKKAMSPMSPKLSAVFLRMSPMSPIVVRTRTKIGDKRDTSKSSGDKRDIQNFSETF